MKKEFMNVEAELIRFETADVLATSTRAAGSDGNITSGDPESLDSTTP